MPLAHCSIGTSTNRINLLDETGIHVGDWMPVAGSVDAEFQTSPLADYRRLKYYRELTTEEEIDFTVKKSSQDDVIVAIQNLRRMCRAAMDYWVESWNNDPVYLAVQASCETNRRYALIHSGGVPEDNNPFGQPFLQQGDRAVMVQQLVLERGPWTETAPGVPVCIEACAPDAYACYPYFLEFGATAGDVVNCASDANIDDLPPGGMVAEAWVRADDYGGLNSGSIFRKGVVGASGWGLRIDSAQGLTGVVYYSVQNAVSQSGLDEFSADGEWHHVAMSFHPTGYNHNGYVRLWIDGSEVSSYAAGRTQANGVYQADAATNLYIGNISGYTQVWEGDIGWCRLWSWPHYRRDGGFTPPPRCEIPGLYYNAAGTQVIEGIWIYEGTGTTTGNLADSGGTAATITLATWGDCDCPKYPGRLCDEEDMCWPGYLEFDGTTDSTRVRLNDANLDDMVDDGLDFSVEAWIRSNDYGAGNAGQICNKQTDPNYGAGQPGWFLQVDNVNGLYFYVYGATTTGYAGSGLDEFDPTDGEWHHILAYKDSTAATTATLYLAIDGVWVTSYNVRQNKTGAYGSDAGAPLNVGNRQDWQRTFDGDIGWMVFRDGLGGHVVGVNFTPRARCLPVDSPFAIASYIHEGAGQILQDLTGNCEPGTVLGVASWDCDCTIEVDEMTSCESPAWIANLLKTSGITDIYWYYDDAAGNTFWSANLLTMPLPYSLTPIQLILGLDGDGPHIYFGSNDLALNGGPFNNLIFDLMQEQSSLTGTWEWYDPVGGWTALTTQDNTDTDGLMTGDPFDTLGVKSVHWEQELVGVNPWSPMWLDVATGIVGAPPVAAWWIRYRCTAIGANPQAVWQQNRHPYTISVPYVEINDEDVPGDIAASLAMKLYNESDHDGGANDPKLKTSRLVCGLRSLNRGDDFVAYLNVSNEGNPAFITFTKDAAWTWETALAPGAPTGVFLYRNIPAGTQTDAGYFTIGDGYTWQFYGEYRCFIRAYLAATGAAGDLSLRMDLRYGNSLPSYTISDWVDNEYTGDVELFDMGRVVIPPTPWIQQAEDTPLGIGITARNNDAGAAHVCRLYDLILMPVDEWAGDFTGTPDPDLYSYLSGNRSETPTVWGGYGRYAFIDSITYPKYDLRVLSLIRDTDNFNALAEVIANRPAILQANRDQRLWFLAVKHESGDEMPSFEICHSVEVYRQANYLSMRGDR